MQGPYNSIYSPRAHEVFDLCTLGLPQVKAAGLVQVYDLLGGISTLFSKNPLNLKKNV